MTGHGWCVTQVVDEDTLGAGRTLEFSASASAQAEASSSWPNRCLATIYLRPSRFVCRIHLRVRESRVQRRRLSVQGSKCL